MHPSPARQQSSGRLRKKRLDGQEQNKHIQEQRAMLYIVEVILDLFAGLADAGGVALAHLRPARNSGLDHMAVNIKGRFLLKSLKKEGLPGPGADRLLFPFHNLENCGSLSMRFFSQKFPNPV